jgi:hypothetical protein
MREKIVVFCKGCGGLHYCNFTSAIRVCESEETGLLYGKGEAKDLHVEENREKRG